MRMTVILAALCAAGSLGAADQTDSSGRGLYDLLGGATWSERRLGLTGGLVSVDIDGTRDDQRAGYLSVSAQGISGYQFKETMPAGGILGLGASINGWRIDDDVTLWAVAPYAVGIAGVYTDLNDRLRVQLTIDAGPGLAYVSGEGDSDLGLGWTWGIEGSLSLSKGDDRGLGIGIGYSEIRQDDLEQAGIYLAITIGF